MPTESLSVGIDGASVMDAKSQIVTFCASPYFHNLCVSSILSPCQSVNMSDEDKNGGPNFLKAWRDRAGLTQAELAEKVGTNSNMIGYLESGERGLSAKWLRRLAPALKTSPGFLLDVDPETVHPDMLEIWLRADDTQRKQLVDVAKALIRDGTSG